MQTQTKNPEPTPSISQTGPGGAHLKLTNILVPVDFSEPSKQALDYAALFARQFQARITLLSVIESDGFAGLEESPLALSAEALEAQVTSQLSELGEKRVGTEHLEPVLVRPGHAPEEIIKAARALKADLIIIATHGHTGLKHVVLGSTAEKVVRLAPCPVLTVRMDKEEAT